MFLYHSSGTVLYLYSIEGQLYTCLPLRERLYLHSTEGQLYLNSIAVRFAMSLLPMSSGDGGYVPLSEDVLRDIGLT